MDTDKIRAGLPQVRQALIRACNNKARTSIPVQPTDDDQVLWQAAEDLEAAATELDTLRAENARLVALVSEAASALRYYADPGNYLDWRGKVVDDASYAALTTLAKLGEKAEESEEAE